MDVAELVKLILLMLVVVPLIGVMGVANFFVGMLVARSGVVDIVKVLGSHVLPDGAVTIRLVDIFADMGDVRAQALSTALLSELAQRHPRGPWGYAVDLLGQGDCSGPGELLRSKPMDELQATQ